MSQKIEHFIKAMGEPGALQDALRKAGSSLSDEQVAGIGRAHGFQVTAAELSSYAANQPLADGELDNVAAAGFGFASMARPKFAFARGADIIDEPRAEGPGDYWKKPF